MIGRHRSGWIVLALAVLAALGLLAARSGSRGQAAPAVALRQVAADLTQPVHAVHAGDGSGRLFIVEQSGLIRVLRDGRLLAAPFLDLRRRVVAGGELGLLSVAFHPRFAATGRFIVNYTTEEGGLRTVVAEYRAGGGADRAAPDERVVLEIAQPFRNHNGGLSLFGPDGMLYIGTGDGGSGGDPLNSGQRLDTLLGKLLRISVDGDAPYRVPPDNPFVGRPAARGEIWAYGLRNPWRFSFDRATGRLFLADVGQNALEEINVIERGGNYGWNVMEGSRCFRPASGCETAGLHLPIAEYGRADGCSVTGGHVYRGTRLRELVGRYLFGDYCSGKIWTLAESAGRWTSTLLLETPMRISSFGEDEAGEVYVVDHRGGVFLITGR